MSERTYNVLFICTGNSARSIMAEGLMNHLSRGRFKAYSAGSHPSGAVNSYALKTLEKWNIPTLEYRSKAWDEFAKPDAPKLDFAFTVCDNAAGEVCPIWPGQPMTAHWGVPDPAAVIGGSEAEIAAAFADAYGRLQNRITIFVNLPFAGLDRLTLQKRLDAIGATTEEKAREA